MRRTAALRRVSKRREREQRVYAQRRAAFLEGKACRVCSLAATDVHHARGRVGSLFLDERFWVPLCGWCHRYVTEHPSWAVAHGYSQSRLAVVGTV
jgi:hypothetical protein